MLILVALAVIPRQIPVSSSCESKGAVQDNKRATLFLQILKASLRTEFEGHICQNLVSLNSQVCLQRLESQRERGSSW